MRPCSVNITKYKSNIIYHFLSKKLDIIDSTMLQLLSLINWLFIQVSIIHDRNIPLQTCWGAEYIQDEVVEVSWDESTKSCKLIHEKCLQKITTVIY
jgi:hypothetical protein